LFEEGKAANLFYNPVLYTKKNQRKQSINPKKVTVQSSKQWICHPEL